MHIATRSPGINMDRDSFRGVSIHAVPSTSQERRELGLVAVTNRGIQSTRNHGD